MQSSKLSLVIKDAYFGYPFYKDSINLISKFGLILVMICTNDPDECYFVIPNIHHNPRGSFRRANIYIKVDLGLDWVPPTHSKGQDYQFKC